MMTDLSSLQDRVDALQRSGESQLAAMRRLSRITLVGFTALGLLVAWMVFVGNNKPRSDVKEMFWLLCHDGATQEERKEAFLVLVESGNSQWQMARLQDLEMPGAELAGADLSVATLDGCNLSRANLEGALLYQVGLEAADLTAANMKSCTMREAWLLRASLIDTDLENADLIGTSLQQVTATNANLRGAVLAETDLLLADLSGADLTGADLTDAKLEATLLVGCNLEGVQFRRAGLLETDFSQSNWWLARGLSVDVLADLKERFAPGEEAPGELKSQFAEWAAEFDRQNPAANEIPPAAEDDEASENEETQ